MASEIHDLALNTYKLAFSAKDLSDATGARWKFNQETYTLSFSARDLSDGDSSKFKQKTYRYVFLAKDLSD